MVMNITEMQNITTLQGWLELPNKITSGTTAWDSVLIAFELVLFIYLMRQTDDLRKNLITTTFISTIAGIFLYTIGLINSKLLLINILVVASLAISFLKHE